MKYLERTVATVFFAAAVGAGLMAYSTTASDTPDYGYSFDGLEDGVIGSVENSVAQSRDGRYWTVRERRIGYLTLRQTRSRTVDTSGRIRWSCLKLKSDIWGVALSLCEKEITLATVCRQRGRSAELATDLNFAFKTAFSMRDVANGDQAVVLQNVEYRGKRYTQILVASSSAEENQPYLYGKAYWISSQFLCNHRGIGF